MTWDYFWDGLVLSLVALAAGLFIVAIFPFIG
jgi:hypothetical protein